MFNRVDGTHGCPIEASQDRVGHGCESSASSRPVTRIVVVDDHDIVRTGLAILLDREEGMKVVGSATTGEEAVQAARRLQPDLIIMDLVLPTLNGIDATKLIRAEFPLMLVIALSASGRPGHVCRALRAGANGYVLKNAPGEEIVLAVKLAICGGQYISPAITPSPLNGLNKATASLSPLEGLSAREHDVLRRIVTGSTSAGIAKSLSLSPKTIETYRGRLMVKLGVRSRTELIRLALEWELPAA
jgi:DNA-binding NarL/FixJ family response regulator